MPTSNDNSPMGRALAEYNVNKGISFSSVSLSASAKNDEETAKAVIASMEETHRKMAEYNSFTELERTQARVHYLEENLREILDKFSSNLNDEVDKDHYLRIAGNMWRIADMALVTDVYLDGAIEFIQDQRKKK